jgi:hypothetical protein
MEKEKWIALLISAITDGVITFGSALLAVTGTTGGQMPSKVAWLTSILGGVMSTFRTIGQGMKAHGELTTAVANTAAIASAKP